MNNLSNSTNDSPSQVKFTNTFWSSGAASDGNDKGFDILMERMKLAKHSLGDYVLFLKEKADMEDEYAKKLIKLTKNNLFIQPNALPITPANAAAATNNKKQAEKEKSPSNESPYVSTIYSSIKHSLDTQAKLHSQIAESIRGAEGIKKVESFANEQREKRKEIQAQMEKVVKKRSTAYDLCTKMNEKLQQKQNELSTLQKQPSNDKLEKQIQKVNQEIQKMQNELHKEVDKYQEVYSQWIRLHHSACETFEQQERVRIQFVRDHVWWLSNTGSQLNVGESATYEQVRQIIETGGNQNTPAEDLVESDIRWFALTFATGSDIPGPLRFDGKNLQHSEPQQMSQVQPAKQSLSLNAPPAYAASSLQPSPSQFSQISQMSQNEMGVFGGSSAPPFSDPPSANLTSANKSAGIGFNPFLEEDTPTTNTAAVGNPFAADMAPGNNSAPKTGGNPFWVEEFDAHSRPQSQAGYPQQNQQQQFSR